MQHSCLLVTAVSAALLCAPSAQAQRTGTRVGPPPAEIPDDLRLSDQDRARVAMYRYAKCAVEKNRSMIELYLKTAAGSKAAHKRANSLSVDDCLSTGEMRFNEFLFRGGVYDVLYQKDYRKVGPLDFAATPDVDYAAVGADALETPSPSHVALIQVADCTVRKAPEEARNLILSGVASKSEGVAFASIVPSMEGCLSQGSQLKFSKSVLRGVIGEALYRLSVRASQPKTATEDL